MRLPSLVVLLALVGAAGPAVADRLHLNGGGTIEVGRWWIEGETLRYQSAAGTVGIPRSLVLRIEEIDDAPSTQRGGSDERVTPAERYRHSTRRDPRNTARASSSRSSEKSSSKSSTRVTREVADRLAEAHAALDERDFESASSAFLEVLRDAPDLPAARVGYAVAEMSLGRDRLALSAVLEGLSRDHEQSEYHELLGDLRDREEQIQEALAAWRQAFRLKASDRLREKILKVERELNVGRDFDLAATAHFTVRYDGDVDRQLADEVMDFLEEQFWELVDTYRHAPPQPITVVLYPSRAFREVTQTPEWVGGIYDGKIRVPLGGLTRLNPQARAVLVHELTHAVVHSKSRGECPRWLHEGLAQIEQGRQVTRADEQKLTELLSKGEPEAWESEGFSYPAALSLTRFLESQRGHDGLVWVLDLMGEGRSVDDALRETYGVDYTQLCRRWAEELVKLDREERR